MLNIYSKLLFDVVIFTNYLVRDFYSKKNRTCMLNRKKQESPAKQDNENLALIFPNLEYYIA